MRLIGLAVIFTLSLILASLAVEAQQQAGKVWRVGDVFAGSAEVSAYLSKALEDRLADRGYVNGRNISLIHQFVPPEPARLEKAIATLISNIDVLVVWGTVSAVAAKKVTGTLPIVFLTVGDPVAIGLAKSLARPGGNMTGVTFEASAETYGKRLQLLKECLPDLRRGREYLPGDRIARTLGAAATNPAPAHRCQIRRRFERRLCHDDEDPGSRSCRRRRGVHVPQPAADCRTRARASSAFESAV